MAEYKGSIELIGGLTPKNNGNFPLVSARDVQVDDTGKRLDEKLAEIGSGGGDADTQTIEEMLQGFDSDPGSVKKYVDEVAGDGAGYAESAEQSAEAAQMAKEGAETAKGEAARQATEATNAAQTATSKATEASNANASAQTAKTAAETAKNEAQALKTEVERKFANGDYNGADGKSAYEYAKDGGYSGTESDFAKKLAKDYDAIISEKVEKTGISLGIASDGLIYVFVDGVPVGAGVERGQSGDVFGFVDENNTVVLTGNLVDGTYTVKYEMDNGDVVSVGNMVLDSNVYYSVTSTLTKCSISNSTKTVVEGGSYTANITANSGYGISSVKVTMGGTDITSAAYSNGKITIASVTGNIVITATAAANTYTVTKNLTNCSISNTASSVTHGSAYNATVTANSGYNLKSVTATMGGSAVTVTNGVISIASVTGNIVITAVAESSGPNNLANPSDTYWKDGHRLSIGSGGTSACEGHVVTNFIPAKMGDVLRVKGMNLTAKVNSQDSKIVMYSAKDNEGSKLGGLYGTTTATDANGYGAKVTVNGDVSTITLLYSNTGAQTATSSMNYIRIDGVLLSGYTKNDVIITINEEIS